MMISKRVLLLGVAALLLGGAVFQPVSASESSLNFDKTLISIDVGEGGDADVSVTYSSSLDSDSERSTFKEFTTNVEQNTSTYKSSFREKFSPTIESAESKTGRSMSLNNLSVSSGISDDGDTGRITYSFTWTNFAKVNGDTVVVGDVLDGMTLTDSMAVVLSWPSSWSVESTSTSVGSVNGDKVVWKGETTLSSPQITLTADSSQSAPTSNESESSVSAPGFSVAASAIAMGLFVITLGRRRFQN